MPLGIKRKPQFKKTIAYLKKLEKYDALPLLHEMGKRGVSNLIQTTPKDDSSTALAWSYKIEGSNNNYKLIWTNSEMAGTAPLVLLLQYGHATRNGGFVYGRDFINPALEPVYKEFVKRLLREVT